MPSAAVIRKFRITAADGKTYDTGHYNLSGIIAVGYKVNSERAVQFRKWATGIIESFTIKGYAIAEIAVFRGSAEATVKTHLNAIYRKAGVSGRGQLVSLLIEDLLRAPLMGEKPPIPAPAREPTAEAG